MSIIRTLSALFLSLTLIAAAQAQTVIKVEVATLGDKTVKGELVSVDEKEVVIKVGDKEEKVPVAQVVNITTDRTLKAPPKDFKYIQVELTDGTEVRCSSVDFKKSDMILTLTNGAKVTVSTKLVK